MNNRRATSIIQGLPVTDGDGVALNRVIGGPELEMLDPFLLLDEFKSSKKANFPPHPHRGFQTVTYLLAGKVKHEDNHGHHGTVKAGGVQWMTAGKGLVHSEVPEPVNGLVHGFQLWVNLPASHKMMPASYHEYSNEQVPKETREQGTEVRVIAGSTCLGTVGAVNGVTTDPLYLDVYLAQNTEFIETLPASHSAFVYVIEGQLEVIGGRGKQGNEVVKKGSLAILGKGEQVCIKGMSQASQFLLIAGKQLKEPVARYGPFVMNDQDQIMQAVTDYQNGNF